MTVISRWRMVSVAMAFALCVASGRGQSQGPAFELPSTDVLMDEPIPIVVSGLTPGARVTVRARGGVWASDATFVADGTGRIDLTRMKPASGRYKDVDPMGLFWSAERQRAAGVTAPDDSTPPDQWALTAEVGGATVARATVRRRLFAADVRVMPVRESGLVGTLYMPPGSEPHPAVLVLGGSEGGIPPPMSAAGGLASRGYAVLALAYFNAPGLPPKLSDIPLEYFNTALTWLAGQPSVDASRIGVLGASRGAELALLLGSVTPAIRTVVAYMPSNVVWRGCCDVTTPVAWTVNGRPIAAMPPPGPRSPLDARRAEIPVEHIHGAVLLISGKDDGVWPSADMAAKVVARLRQNDFQYPVQSLVYDSTGHAILRPFTSTMELNGQRHPLSGRIVNRGGTPAGTAKARADSWPKMLAFVDEHLRGAATR